MTETPPSAAVTEIRVSGFKSIHAEQSIAIKPLTILAGANSSGKSSIMQAVLLLKQTVEAPYDAGALRLDGPNVNFTSSEQVLSHIGKSHRNSFSVGFSAGAASFQQVTFKRRAKQGFNIDNVVIRESGEEMTLREGMDHNELDAIAPTRLKGQPKRISPDGIWRVTRNRCFLDLSIGIAGTPGGIPIMAWPQTAASLTDLLHVPGLRGNPSRTYPVTAVGPTFPGTFETYTASVIANWQAAGHKAILDALSEDLEELGLTWTVAAKRVDDTQVELQVGRLPHALKGNSHDLVNIADAGFGVSQTLPVIVALHAAKPAQLVYIEQPEIHLHPRAQTRLAHVIAAAVKRGVHVVAETHSALLLLELQALVAEGTLPAKDVQLHWFERTGDGSTQITPASLDENGAFGAWPEDFSDVLLKTQDEYLTAVERREASARVGQ